MTYGFEISDTSGSITNSTKSLSALLKVIDVPANSTGDVTVNFSNNFYANRSFIVNHKTGVSKRTGTSIIERLRIVSDTATSLTYNNYGNNGGGTIFVVGHA